MKGVELIEQYPKAGEIVLQWFKGKMQAALSEADDLTDSLKESFAEYTVSKDHMGLMIDTNPRMLFDVFDENSIFIEIYKKTLFSYSINEGEVVAGAWSIRKEAETSAIEQAFILLDKK